MTAQILVSDRPRSLVGLWKHFNKTSQAYSDASVMTNDTDKPKISRDIVQLGNEFFTNVVDKRSPDYATIEEIILENSTTAYDPPKALESRLMDLFSIAKSEDFDDSLEGALARGLSRLIGDYQKIALDLIYQWIVSDQIDRVSASEAVILIGRFDAIDFRQIRREFLLRCLRVTSARIRYAAILGLIYLNDPKSLNGVKAALDDENIESMKRDMHQLITQLEKTALEIR